MSIVCITCQFCSPSVGCDRTELRVSDGQLLCADDG